MKPIRVLLAEDHTLVRAGIRALLQDLEGIQVVGEAGNGREALDLIEMHEPDVVLMDIAMEGLNGLETTARVKKHFPKVGVLILSMYDFEEYVLQALRAGAMGYLLKDAQSSELGVAIKAVARGETYLSSAVSKYVVANYVQRTGIDAEKSSFEQLTPRQREVLQLIAEGQTTKEMAHTLQINAKTVDTHRRQW